MNSSEIFDPKLGRFVYKHKGSGIIVNNILKPMRRAASSLTKTVVKPFAKKALQSGISHAGDKLGKKAAEKSGDFIVKKLASQFSKTKTPSIRPKCSSQTRGINRHGNKPFDIWNRNKKEKRKNSVT